MISVSSYAQTDLTLYNFDAIAQSLHVNPAAPQQTEFWVGLPAVSGIHVHFQNSGFTLLDLLATDSDINANIREIAKNLDTKSHFSLQQDVDLFGLGFKMGKGFLSLGATQSTSLRMGYPGDIFKFISFRPGDDITGFSLNELDFESMTRTNIYLGYQHKFIKNRLTVGFRGKYVVGQQHSFIESIDAQVDASDPFLLKVRSNIHVKSSGLSTLLADDFDPSNDPVSIVFTDNTGIAFDFGADFKITRKWSASVSVLDLGSITWKEGNEDYRSQGEFDFEGIELDLAKSSEFNTIGTALVDSITDIFSFDTIEGTPSYTRALPTRYFAALNYAITPKHSLGILYHAKTTFDGEMISDYSANYQGRWFRGMQFIATYSLINGSTNNVGAGVDFKFGPLQLYLISDNILGAVMYENLETTNIRLGLNITFYGKKDKDPKYLPFLEAPVRSKKSDKSEDDEDE